MPDQGLASFSNGTIPPAPSFTDFRFSTIGQEPPLLKRFSAQSPNLHHNGPSSSCPSSPAPGELEYPPTVESPRPLSRPTLLQSLAYSNPSGIDTTAPNTFPASQSVDARETRSVEPPLVPHRQIPASSQHTSTASSAVPSVSNTVAQGTATSTSPALSSHKGQNSMSTSPLEMGRAPGIYTAPTAKCQTPFPATTTHQAHSSYSALHALQARLMTSLSKLHPPDMTDALLRVQSANSYSVNALTTAHRSHILAQQSLATAQEAVAAAQESLNAAEQARTHANNALTAIRQLHSGKAGFDAEGSADWQWKVNYIQMQDDLRMLGEWVAEKENEDAKIRDVDQQDARAGDGKVAEAVKCAIGISASHSHAVQEMSSEVSRRISAETSRVASHLDLTSNWNLDHRRSLELEAEAATQAWSSEQSHASKGLPPIITDVVPMEVEVDLAEYLPPKADGETLQVARQPAQTNEAPHSSTQYQETLMHLSGDEARLQRQHKETRLREKKIEVMKLPMMQQEHMVSELPESAVNGLRLKPKNDPTANENTDKLQPPRSQSSAIAEDVNRALQVNKDKKAAPAEKSEQKRAATRHLLEERKQRELAELKKKKEEEEEELTAAKEQKLIAEQEKRRQEIMAQKQRATAETAARINAERAREREKAMAASLQSSASTTLQPPLPDRPLDSGNPVAKKTTTSKPTQKPKSLSVGGVKLGPITDEQPQSIVTSGSLPPSAALARSAALGLRPLKAQTPINTGPEHTKAGNVSSRKAASIENPLQNTAIVVLPTPTPTDGMNTTEDFHVYRHSDDPGDLCVVPRSQVVSASPEAQAVNLRFVKDGNGVRWDTSTVLEFKSDPGHMNQSSLHRNSPVSVKKELPIPPPLIGSEALAPKSADPSPRCSLLANPCPPAPLSSLKRHPNANKNALIDQRGVTGTTEAAPASSTTVSSFVNVIDTSSAAPSSNTRRRPPSNITPPNPHRDSLSSHSKPLLPSKPPNVPLTTPLATLDMTTIDPILPDDAAQIAPMIHANGGWDRPMDEEIYSGETKVREPTPPQRLKQLRRGGDHYSPPRPSTPNHYASRGYATRSISPIARSPPSPPQRSLILGKRRQREDVREDEHPSRRQWPSDGTRRTRSPPPHLRQSTQWRSASPDRPALQARMQVTDHSDMSHARLPSSRELAWRSPSPDRPALQARIGVRDLGVRAINGGQSYRPTYSSDTYERSQPRTRNNHQSGQADQSTPGYRLPAEPESRGPSFNRGRGSMNSNRASPRGRGNRGGNRPLNLEQRISSSSKPLTLINRLESSPRS